MNITIPYKPRNWARALHDSAKRWNVVVMHRRAGKTTAGLNHLQRDALSHPDSFYAYIAPTYRQAKRVAWDMLKFFAQPIPDIKINEAELLIRYPNGAKLQLFGADNPDALRGLGLGGVVFDEYSQQPSNIFSEIISKTLADKLGYAIWIGTPKGKNEFYRLFEQGKNDEDWLTILGTIEDSFTNEEGETIENLRQALEDDKKMVRQGLMTEDEYMQEWFCSFEAAIKGAYYISELAKARKEKRITAVPYDPALKVHTVWDLGIGQAMSIGFYQRIGAQLRKIDYWEGSNQEGLPQAIKMVKNKEYVYGKHFAPHDIKAKDISTGKTRLETAQRLGIQFELVKKVPVDDGIHAARLAFNHLWVDSIKCAFWVDAISQYKQEWDENRGMFKQKPYNDWTNHAADEYRYAAIVEDQMTNEEQSDFHQIPYEPQSEYEGGDTKPRHHPELPTTEELGMM